VLQEEKPEALAPYFDQWAGGPGQTRYETAGNEGIAKYAAKYPHCSRAYGAWAEDSLKAAKASGKPFCMSISFKAPHMLFTSDPIDFYPVDGHGDRQQCGKLLFLGFPSMMVDNETTLGISSWWQDKRSSSYWHSRGFCHRAG